jgi:hypothetical protein
MLGHPLGNGRLAHYEIGIPRSLRVVFDLAQEAQTAPARNTLLVGPRANIVAGRAVTGETVHHRTTTIEQPGCAAVHCALASVGLDAWHTNETGVGCPVVV